MKIVFIILITIHGLIHLLGFVKAYNLAPINQLGKDISKLNGIIWLISTILFIITAILFFINKDSWWILSAISIIISQYLIFVSWQDAKFGTIANLIILIVTIIGFGVWSFSGKYKNEVTTYLNQTSGIKETILTETDIRNLPESVKKYIRLSGAVGKPKVINFKIEFSGQIRKNEQSEWMPFKSEQYNFLDASVRLFFMNAEMKHLPVAGFHCFNNGIAFMDIRLFSLFKVQYQSGKEMGTAETVTFFNDMCCMAPAALIDKRIKWLDDDSNKVKAEFTNNGITIFAILYFNDKGELINFISGDRYAAEENGTMRKLPWSTPLKDYKKFNDYYLAGYADAVYTYPEGDLCYGNFRLNNIDYNCKEFK